MSARLWLGIAGVTLVATPLALFWWLLRSVGQAIERINP